MMTQTTVTPPLNIDQVSQVDPELTEALLKELDRQQSNIELIASENFTSLAVMQAQGTWLTNKYAEGLPGKRYYGGCEHVDVVEQIAIDRAKELFGAEHANVQLHSGASANNAVFFALLNPGDRIMGMNLSHGGHLTHGSPVNISGKHFDVVAYGVDKETERIDYDLFEKEALEKKPKLIIAGASAYPRQIDFERIAQIAKKVGAIYMVDMAHIAGLVAAGKHPSPVPHADVVTSTTHKTLRGPRGGVILCKEKYQKEINKAVFPGTQGGPLMHVIAAKAICFKEAMTDAFRDYQENIVQNSKALAAQFQKRGVRLASGGSDNHLVLLNLSDKGLTGKEVENQLDEVGITVNKNTVPFDKESPFVTSGIRIGTAAVTTRGMGQDEMVEIADLISDIIDHLGDEQVNQKVASKVKALTDRFPLYIKG